MATATNTPLQQGLAQELDAILHGAATAPITDASFLRITGPDATRWLNGMVTNNIKDLSPGQGNENFLLNAQGRIVGTCTIFRESHELAKAEPSFLLKTDHSQLKTVHETLDRFIIMDDVELTPTMTDSIGLRVLGKEAHATLEQAGLAAPQAVGLDESSGPVELLVLSLGHNTFELWGEASSLMQVASTVDLPRLSPEAQDAYRILSGIPRYGIDIRNTDTAKDLPQETGQTQALHFNKGCYLGQEIVERIHSRGQVHRQFTRFTLTGSLPATLPQPLEANGKLAGELTSAIQIGETLYALGYARREALELHTPLTYPGGTAAPRPEHPLI